MSEYFLIFPLQEVELNSTGLNDSFLMNRVWKKEK